jgi:transposase
MLIQPTRRGAAPIIDVGLVRWTTTDRRFWVWSDAPRVTREHCTACVRLTVSDNPQQATIQPQVEKDTLSTTLLNTDESYAYHHIADTGRGHVTVCHSHFEYARDDDNDGFCEVHCNTLEGIWTGLRNFLRPFRGVHKKYLAAYVAIFEWAHNLKRVTIDFLRT